MTINWSHYSLAELKAHSVRRFRRGGGSRPDVLLIEIDGQFAVLKDQGAADKWFAFILGPILTWRETTALKRLESLDCIPQLLAIPSRRAFVMGYHDSEQISRLDNIEPDWPDFFKKLQASILAMHKLGVVHNDLRNPSNILITPTGEPILVDLVACFFKGGDWNVPKRWLFNKFAQVDLSALTKLKGRFAPDCLSANEVYPEAIAGKPGLAIKQLGQWIRRITRGLFTQKPH